jgi:hypothetical protein
VEVLTVKSKSTRFVLALITLTALQTALFGHHSAAMFDNTKVIEIQGTVKEFQWTNPHIWIQVNVQGPAGLQEWSIEGGGPNNLSRQGWRPTSFKAGETVTFRINPMRDGTPAGLFVGAKFSDAKTLGRWEAQP